METIKEIVLKSMDSKTVRYSVVKSNECGKLKYGIEVCESCKNGTLKETVDNISDSKKEVLNLIDYLSENVIDTAHFKDIVEDYMYSHAN